MSADPDPSTRAELAFLLETGDAAGLRARFDSPLSFGTAGLRGALGAGPARMNRLVVRRATAGVARWLLGKGPEAAARGIVVGRDARHGSDQFARDVASIASAAGVRVRVLPAPLPTPVTAFAVKHLGAAAGVMVTASHNPAADNGYKVYAEDGAQVIPPDDGEIAAAAASAPAELIAAAGATAQDGEVIDEAELLAAYGRAAARAARSGRAASAPDRLHAHARRRGSAPARAAGPGWVRTGLDRVRPGRPGPRLPDARVPQSRGAGGARSCRRGRHPPGCRRRDRQRPRCGPSRRCRARSGLQAWRRLTGDELGVLLADHLLRVDFRRRPACGHDDRLVAGAVEDGRRGRSRLRRDPHGIQVDREGATAPAGHEADLRLRGGARLRSGRGRVGQGRADRRARGGGDRRRSQGAGIVRRRSPRRALRPIRSARHLAVVTPALRHRARQARWQPSWPTGGATHPANSAGSR